MRRGGDTSTERCKNYYGEEGYCDLGDRCEYRHGEDAGNVDLTTGVSSILRENYVSRNVEE